MLSEKESILEHIHKGFRYSLELELITNIKSALIQQIKEDESTKKYGDMLSYMAPLFLMTYNARANIVFKDIESMKSNPVGEKMMTNFSSLFSDTIGRGEGIKDYLKQADYD